MRNSLPQKLLDAAQAAGGTKEDNPHHPLHPTWTLHLPLSTANADAIHELFATKAGVDKQEVMDLFALPSVTMLQVRYQGHKYRWFVKHHIDERECGSVRHLVRLLKKQRQQLQRATSLPVLSQQQQEPVPLHRATSSVPFENVPDWVVNEMLGECIEEIHESLLNE